MLGAAPRVGPFSLLVARPYSFLDVGLDFQANELPEPMKKMKRNMIYDADECLGKLIMLWCYHDHF